MKTQRRIIHIDMDAFFAAIEQRDNPALRGLPVVVGGSPESRSVVSTCSYEARKFGIHSGMPAYRAKQRCPHAIFIFPRFKPYQEASQIIHKIFRKYTDSVEGMSLDEAYLDVTDCTSSLSTAAKLATVICNEIYEATHLTASAGVSYNLFFAKIASDMNKPKGLTVISEDNMTAIMSSLPIRKFQGVGPVTEQKLLRAGILTGQDLLDLGAENLQTRLGDFGLWLYTMVTGKDERQVTTHHERKSLGHEYTLEHDLTDRQTMLTHLKQITDKVCLDMNREELTGNTITVKIRYNNFSYASRRLTVKNPISKTEEVFPIVRNLLYALQIRRPIRLLGVTISAFCKPVADDAGEQLELPLFA